MFPVKVGKLARYSAYLTLIYKTNVTLNIKCIKFCRSSINLSPPKPKKKKKKYKCINFFFLTRKYPNLFEYNCPMAMCNLHINLSHTLSSLKIESISLLDLNFHLNFDKKERM